jgi:hypothetical protein
MQSRIMSAIETATNIAVGLVVSFLAQMVILPLYDIHISMSENVQITIFFTAVSIVRGYALRRIFNRIRYGR